MGNGGMAVEEVWGCGNFDEDRGVFGKWIRHRKAGSGDAQILYTGNSFVRGIRNLRIGDESVSLRTTALLIHGNRSEGGELHYGTIFGEPSLQISIEIRWGVLERGEVNISLLAIATLAQVLRVKPADLIQTVHAYST